MRLLIVRAAARWEPDRPICIRLIGDADLLGVADDLVGARLLSTDACLSSLETDEFSSSVEFCRSICAAFAGEAMGGAGAFLSFLLNLMFIKS